MQIGLLVDNMASKGSGYDARELHGLGVSGLAAVLDHFLPDTAPPAAPLPAGLPEATVRKLIADLEHDDFQTRERATDALATAGRGQRKLIEEAAASQQAEMALRAQRIIATWESRPQARLSAYLSGFWAYVEKIEDPQRLNLLAGRTMKAFEQGMPEGDRLHLLRLCLAGVAHGRDGASCDLLRPLVDHQDVRVAVLAAETVGAYKTEASFFPTILVDALHSKRQEVAETALRFAAGSSDQKQRAALHRALRTIFEQQAKTLKFQACLPLIRDFHDPQAWVYVLEQTQSKDANRSRTACNWVGDSAGRGAPASAELAAALAPLLKSPSADLRRWTVQALGSYSGDPVVRSLLPLLGDSDESVVRQVGASLRKQPDQNLVKRLVRAANVARSDVAARSLIREVLRELEQP
jgi:HEAT repeat protein